MAVEQKKSAFDKANDKSEPRVNNNAEIEDKASEEKLSEDELEAVAGGSTTFALINGIPKGSTCSMSVVSAI